MEDVKMVNDSTNKGYVHCWQTPGQEKKNFLGDMVENHQLHAWDSQAMKVI